jgi:hypothetical protein
MTDRSAAEPDDSQTRDPISSGPEFAGDPYLRSRAALAVAVIEGPGRLAPTIRRDIVDRGRTGAARHPIPSSLVRLVDLVIVGSPSITDADVHAASAAEGEEAVFEAIVAAALGAGLARLERVDDLLRSEV